jgi:hypothetical protein
MTEVKVEERQEFQKNEPRNWFTRERKVLFIFPGLLIISIIVYFTFDNLWTDFIFGHLGGLGIVGILGGFTAIIASRKGYSYWNVFLFGFIYPIIFGVFFAFVIYPLSCGGSVSIAVALLIVIFYSLVKKNYGVQTN